MMLLSLSLLACAGGGTLTLDDTNSTSADDTSSTDDSGERSDDTEEPPDDTEEPPDDTGEPPDDGMNPDYVYFTQYWAVSAEGKPTSWITDDGNELPPLVVSYYFDERYFDAGDDQYVCYEYFQLTDPIEANDGSWGVFTFTFNHLPGSSDDPCDFGAGPLDGESTKLGVDFISDDIKGQLQEAIESEGDDFVGQWEPYVLGGYAGDFEVGWALLLELDDDLKLVQGDNCAAETACRELPDGDPGTIPGPSVIYGSSWYVISPEQL